MRTDEFWQGIWAGLTGGVIVASLLTSAVVAVTNDWRINQPLEQCAKANNVFKCEITFTPVNPFQGEGHE